MIAVLFFAVGAALAAFVFLTTDWRRVGAVLRAQPTTLEPLGREPHRWRRVHIDGDRRAPFARIERRR